MGPVDVLTFKLEGWLTYKKYKINCQKLVVQLVPPGVPNEDIQGSNLSSPNITMNIK